MSSINTYRSVGPEDYLAAGENERKSKKAGKTAQTNIAISGYLPAPTAETVTTLAQVDADTREATTSETVTTLAARTTFTTPFEWYFQSGSEPTHPLKWGFFDWRFST